MLWETIKKNMFLTSCAPLYKNSPTHYGNKKNNTLHE